MATTTWTLFGAPMRDGERKGTDLKFRISEEKIVPYFMKVDGEDKTVYPVHAVFVETKEGEDVVYRKGKNGEYPVKGVYLDFEEVVERHLLNALAEVTEIDFTKKSVALVNLYRTKEGKVFARSYKSFYPGELMFIMEILKGVQMLPAPLVFKDIPQTENGDYILFNTTGTFFPDKTDGIGIFTVKAYGKQGKYPKTHVVVGFHYGGANMYLSLSETEAFYMYHMHIFGGDSQTLYRDQSKGGYSNIVRQFFIETDPSLNYLNFTVREKRKNESQVMAIGEVKASEFLEAVKGAIIASIAWQGCARQEMAK